MPRFVIVKPYRKAERFGITAPAPFQRLFRALGGKQ